MNKLNVQSAYTFYNLFILDTEKALALKHRGFSINGTVAPALWECMGAELLDLRKRPGYGADLKGWEVKSVHEDASGVEYQYHRESGVEKLNEDMAINHLYLFYGNEYQDVTAMTLTADDVRPVMKEWMTKLELAYSKPSTQRCRCALKRSFIKANGKVVFRIINGKLVA